MEFQVRVRHVSSLRPTQRVTGKRIEKNSAGEDVILDEVEYGSELDQVLFEKVNEELPSLHPADAFAVAMLPADSAGFPPGRVVTVTIA